MTKDDAIPASFGTCSTKLNFSKPSQGPPLSLCHMETEVLSLYSTSIYGEGCTLRLKSCFCGTLVDY